MSSMHKTNDENIKARPSKLFLYEKFYTDLDTIRENTNNFSITDFACGESKTLEAIRPSYYQGIDLKEDLINISRKKFTKDVNNATYFTVRLFLSLLLVKNIKKAPIVGSKIKEERIGKFII